MRTLLRVFTRWEGFLLLVLAVTLVLGSQSSRYFMTASNLSIALASMAPVALMALPMTLIIMTGEIDISVGSMIGLCATVLAASIEHGFGIGWAMLAALAVGTLAGLLNGVFVVAFGLPSLVVTIGTLALYRGIAQIILKERGVNNFPEWYQNLGFATIGQTPIPWSIVPFAVLFVGFATFLHATYWGRAIFAIGNNREAAHYSGIKVGRTKLAVFTVSGMMAALAAVVLTAYLASARSDTAVGLELPVITAVVLGGVNIFGGSGTLGGVFVALLVLAFVQNALGLAGMTPEQQEIVTGAVLIATLVVFAGGASLRRAVSERMKWVARGPGGRLPDLSE
jgi:rhamnose transport system permease protein